MKGKWKLGRLRIAVSQRHPPPRVREPVKRRLTERVRESRATASATPRSQIYKLEPKLKAKVSDEYKKQVRVQIREQKDLLRARSRTSSTPGPRS